MKNAARSSRRAYRQKARAQAAEATARRIVRAFDTCVRDRWFDEVTLEEVADRAGVTVRTVIRRFGGKRGLIRALTEHVAPQIRTARTAASGYREGTVRRVLALYEDVGDMAIRNLAEEARYEDLRPLIEFSRAEHRKITAETFAKWLEGLSERDRRRTVDALVIATDVYTWKLLRRDMHRSLGETRAVVLALVQDILDRALRARPLPKEVS